MPLTNKVAIQQRQVRIEEQVQEHEQKDKVSSRVVDPTYLRIYFPRVPDAVSMIPIISALLLERPTIATLICQDEAFITQGQPLLLFAYSPSLPTTLQESTWLNFIKIFLIFQRRIHHLTHVHSWRVMENI